MKPLISSLTAAAVLGFAAQVSAQSLFIDFNSTNQDGGPHNEDGYQAYNAGHEVAADFVTRTYSAFGTTVSLTPAWPNTTAATVQQMIDRVPANDVQWLGTKINLLTDWLGIDTRTTQAGNGAYDGITGTPTYMTLTLADVPAGEYSWRSYHHDTENMWTQFQVELSIDGGGTFSNVANSQMTDSSTGGTPDSGALRQPGVAGQDPATLPSTVNFSITADGSQNVVVRFIPLSSATANTHQTFFGINGFEMVAVPEPSTVALLSLGGLALLMRRWQRRD